MSSTIEGLVSGFRSVRLIAATIPKGTFLVESVSYVPEHRTNVPLEIVQALLNSKLAEWYFRLGSTNAMVSEYQLRNLPCPEFNTTESPTIARCGAKLFQP